MTQEQKIIWAKVGLLELAKQLGNSLPREGGGQPSLQNDGVQPGQLLPFQGAVRQRGRAGIAGDQPPQADLKNRTPIEIEQAVVALAIEQPAWVQVRVSEALKRRGLSIPLAG
jgi:hypothetical protein